MGRGNNISKDPSLWEVWGIGLKGQGKCSGGVEFVG